MEASSVTLKVLFCSQYFCHLGSIVSKGYFAIMRNYRKFHKKRKLRKNLLLTKQEFYINTIFVLYNTSKNHRTEVRDGGDREKEEKDSAD
jgi:hypothetical protein